MIYLSEIQLKRDLPPGTYLDELMVVRYLLEQGRLAFDRPVTFLVGENGAGKSTLLEGIAVACGFNPEGGTRNFLFSTQDTHSPLGQYLTPVRTRYFKDGFFLRAESFYNAASYVDELQKEDPSTLFSYGGTSLHKQSHGESFLALVQNRFGGDGLYILDEPEAALSPSRLLTLMGEIARLVEAHSQFIISTHSPICPKYQDVSDWTHMAFSGGSQSDFLNASPLRTVLLDLKSWLREGDVLCWWSKGGKDRLDSYLKHYGIALPTEQHRFLQGYITLLAEQRGLSAANPYHMAKALGLSTTAKQHYSPDDVAMVQRLLQYLNFPQAKLLLPTKAKKTKTSSKSHPDMLYRMDIEHNLLHRRDCPHIPPGALLTEHETINACITGTATACPHCLGAELRQARIDRNKRIIKGSNYVFVYTPGSSVFHQANCPHILDATVINGFGSFDKGVKAGLRPCKHCQPSVNDQVSKVRLGAPQPLPPKKELQAIVRFNKAKMERKEAELEAMTDQEREDFLTLTNPGYGFWAAAGYGTFHSRSCRKMKGLTKIRGFAKYDEAIRAGFTPCKYRDER